MIDLVKDAPGDELVTFLSTIEIVYFSQKPLPVKYVVWSLV